MVTEQNTEIIRQLYASVISRKEGQLAGKPRRWFTQYTVSAKPSSLKTFNAFFETISAAFPDYELTLDNLIPKGDRVMVRYTICGTHQGEFMGLAPSHDQVTVTGIDVFRLDNGRVVEHWDAAHQVSALPQLSREPAAAASGWVPGERTHAVQGKQQLSLSI